ncbi:hypothetical protein FRC17_005313, partial [Serendipita sp. 399]
MARKSSPAPAVRPNLRTAQDTTSNNLLSSSSSALVTTATFPLSIPRHTGSAAAAAVATPSARGGHPHFAGYPATTSQSDFVIRRTDYDGEGEEELESEDYPEADEGEEFADNTSSRSSTN